MFLTRWLILFRKGARVANSRNMNSPPPSAKPQMLKAGSNEKASWEDQSYGLEFALSAERSANVSNSVLCSSRAS
jgi:hypothetical protein